MNQAELNCQELQQKHAELKDLRVKYAAEVEIFKKNPQYERLSYQEMMERLEEIETKFGQIYDNLSEKFLPLEIRKALSKDYQECVKNMSEFYNLIQADPEKPGRYFYQGDYDGSAEAGAKGRNFNNEKFVMPTLPEIFEMLTKDQIRLYQQMREKGLEPKLQLTPIALKLRTIAAKLDAKKDKINEVAGKKLLHTDTYIEDDKEEDGVIDETKLIYEPKTVEAIENDKELYVGNGLSKSEFIKKYQGWLIQIVSSLEDLPVEKEIIYEDPIKKKQTRTFAKQISLNHKVLQKTGYRGLSYESYLIAQMNKLKEGQVLEGRHWTVLSESSLIKSRIITYASWNGLHIVLGTYSAGNRDDGMRLRCSVVVGCF